MREVIRLKKIDKKVLSRLQMNSRESFSGIGKKLRKSQQQISYTVASLEKKKVIQNMFTLMDYSRFDVIVFGVFFRVNYTSESAYTKLIEGLVKDPHTSWVATCGGRFDLVAAFFTRNPSMFNKVLHGVMESFSKQLRNYSVLTWVVRRGFSRKYLFEHLRGDAETIIGGDREPIKLDLADLKLLDLLANDARASSVLLAGKLDLTPKTVIERIRKLEAKEVIKGYKTLLDLRKIGYSSRLLLIRYHNVLKELEDKFIKFLRAHPNVLSVVKTLGEWDVEVEMEAPDFWDLRKAEMKMREQFAELIQDIEAVPLYHTYKRTFFPKFILDDLVENKP